jgi:hypothetical protein
MRLFDASALSLSGLCLIHCLVMPVAAIFMPALLLISHAEWVHTAFLVFAVPMTSLALWSVHRHHPLPRALILVAVLGLACLAGGAFGWPLQNWAEQITIAGSLLLVTAHIWNWRRGTAAHPAASS